MTDITKLAEKLKRKFKLPAFHYIELYIYFSNFLNDTPSITKDSFSVANINLITTYNGNTGKCFDEHAVGIKFTEEIITALQPSLSDDSISIESLIDYLKLLSVEQSGIITEEILFAILDKEDKGYVTYPDVLNFLTGLEEFIVAYQYENNESECIAEFNEKILHKIFKRKDGVLDRNGFIVLARKVRKDIEGLLKDAEGVINKKVAAGKNKFLKKKFDIPNVETVNMINIEYQTESSKDEDKDELNGNADVDRKFSINMRNLSIKDNFAQNIYRVSSINTLGYNPTRDNTQNINTIPFATPKNIYESFLDTRKKEALDRIRMQSYLYDLSISEFVSEFCLLFDQKIDKRTFVDIMTGIINKHTSDFHSYLKKLALSELFSIIDTDHKNEITYQEAIGAIIPLTNGSTENKMKIFWQCLSQGKREEVCMLISGVLSLYLNTGLLISEPKILSEILVDKLISLDITENYSAFTEWMNSESEIGESTLHGNKKNKASIEPLCVAISFQHTNSQSQSELDEEENKNENNDNGITTMMSNVISKFLDSIQSIRSKIDPNIRRLNILLIVQILKKYSLLGEINKIQIISALERIIEQSGKILKDIEKSDYINSLVDLLGLDFSKSELFEISQIHSKLIILFDGTANEKINSVFDIFDCLDCDTGLSYNELFTFMLGALQFFSLNAVDMNLSSHVIKKITLGLVDEIFKYSNLNKNTDRIKPMHVSEFYDCIG